MHNYCQKYWPIDLMDTGTYRSIGYRHLPLHNILTEMFNFPISDQILALASHLQG